MNEVWTHERPGPDAASLFSSFLLIWFKCLVVEAHKTKGCWFQQIRTVMQGLQNGSFIFSVFLKSADDIKPSFFFFDALQVSHLGSYCSQETHCMNYCPQPCINVQPCSNKTYEYVHCVSTRISVHRSCVLIKSI